jgi:hypothetical protein
VVVEGLVSVVAAGLDSLLSVAAAGFASSFDFGSDFESDPPFDFFA